MNQLGSQVDHMICLVAVSDYTFYAPLPSKFQCCGLDQGYEDWGYNISESCVCTEESTKPCVSVTR